MSNGFRTFNLCVAGTAVFTAACAPLIGQENSMDTNHSEYADGLALCLK